MSCGGDSGGPYFLGDFDTALQLGIVSYGPLRQNCDNSQSEFNRDIATRVSYFFDWITSVATDMPPQCGYLDLGSAFDTRDCANQLPGEYVLL
jgi:secreted trypsin-like serine protease